MAMTNSFDGDATIVARADACLGLFERCLSEQGQAGLTGAAESPESVPHLALPNGDKESVVLEELQVRVQVQEHEEWAEIQMDRFNVWAANLGVFAFGHASVDYRLRDCSEISTLILQLLSALQANLLLLIEPVNSKADAKDRHLDEANATDEDQASEKSSSKNTIERPTSSSSTSSFAFSSIASSADCIGKFISGKNKEAQIGVEAVVSRLNRLSASIRQSGIQHRDAKAATFIDKDEFGNDLTSQYAVIASIVVDHKFPAAEEVIRQRLAKSIAQRRNQFAYRRKHQQKLATKQIEIRPAPTGPATEPGDAESSKIPPHTASMPGQRMIQIGILSNTSASVPDPEHLRRRMETPSSKAPTVFSAITTQAGELPIPPPPKIDSGDVFQCPYCFILCPVREAEEKYWRHHVMKDLAPYICLVPECNKPQELFRTTDDWIAHIQTEHTALEWQCLAPAHAAKSFDDQKLYQEHMRQHHPDSFAESQLSLLAQMSARPVSHRFITCPLCNGLPAELAAAHPDQETNEAQIALQSHIAQHLQSLALLSLTWLYEAKSTAFTEEDRIMELEDCLAPPVFLDPPSHDVHDAHAVDVYVDKDWGDTLPVANDIYDDRAWAEWLSKDNDPPSMRDEWEFCNEISLPPDNGHLNDEKLAVFAKRYMESKATDNLCPPNTTWVVPFHRNANFVGRECELDELSKKLLSQDYCQCIALTGLGGVGKTQIILEFVYRMRESSPNCSIFWVPANNSADFEQAYLQIGLLLQIPGIAEDNADVKLLVKAWLSEESSGQWLLVIDNADYIDTVQERPNEMSLPFIHYLPTSPSGSTVFTTRSATTAKKLAESNVINIDVMYLNDAMHVLRKSLIHTRLLDEVGGVTELVKLLGQMPLALVQAASYLNETGMSISEYIILLKGSEQYIKAILGEGFQDPGRYLEDMKIPGTSIWTEVFDEIHRVDELAVEYLAFMACLARADIPRSLLPPGPSKKDEEAAIRLLLEFSFITTRVIEESVDLRQSAHLATRTWLRQTQNLAASTERTLSRLEDVFPYGDHNNRAIWMAYLPHARHVLASPDLPDGSKATKISLLLKVGSCFRNNRQYGEAEQIQRHALDLGQEVLGPEHPKTLTIMNNLSLVLKDQGKYEAAEEMGCRALDGYERTMGTKHPSTLRSVSNLALVLWGQGKIAAAEFMYQRALDGYETVMGKEHPDTLTSVNSLASILDFQGKYEMAEEMYVRALYGRAEALGKEHPDTLISVNNLAVLYGVQGRCYEAEQLAVQAIESSKRVLGQEHPDTLILLSNLASMYMNQERFKQAKELEVQVMEMRKIVLGLDHPDTLASIHKVELLSWRNLVPIKRSNRALWSVEGSRGSDGYVESFV